MMWLRAALRERVMTESQTRTGHGRGSRLLAGELTLAAVCGLTVTIIWVATGADHFWPMWIWFSLALPLALQVVLIRGWSEPRGPRRRLVLQGAVSALLGVSVVVIWAMAGGGFFWPVYPLLGLAVAFTLHGAVYSPRQADLSERVEELTRTRRGALDMQSAELRRIERDLHDGAQARLVALTLQLGRAEARLDDQPETAELVRRAREEATAAIAELRDLARGIAPPVLADRGLVAAVQGLAQRSGMGATVDARMPDRPPPVVESAAYFVTAESLTNAAKHAPGAAVRVSVRQARGELVIEVADDGPGGADPAGSGITGLRQRVEALDGSLSVRSAPGAGTTVTAVLPCE
jgi:signal transduction histidine kinase